MKNKTVIKALWLTGHGYNMGLVIREIYTEGTLAEPQCKAWIGLTKATDPIKGMVQPVASAKEDADHIMKTGAKFPYEAAEQVGYHHSFDIISE